MAFNQSGDQSASSLNLSMRRHALNQVAGLNQWEGTPLHRHEVNFGRARHRCFRGLAAGTYAWTGHRGVYFKSIVAGVVGILLLMLAPLVTDRATAWAQGASDWDEVEVAGTAYFRFVRTGEVTIEVMALGSIRSPGVYAVGLGMTLDQLLGLAGGAADIRRSSAERVRVMVRLYRQNGAGRTLVYEESMEDVLAGTGQYPVLQSRDTLVVEQVVRQRWFTLDRTLQLLSTAATFTLLMLRIRDIAN